MKTRGPLVTLFGTTLAILFLAGGGWVAVAPQPSSIAAQANSQTTPMPLDADKAKHLVLMEFPVLHASHMPRDPINDDAIKGVFPGYHFFVVNFGFYPVGHGGARGFDHRNLIVVTKDGKVLLLKQ